MIINFRLNSFVHASFILWLSRFFLDFGSIFSSLCLLIAIILPSSEIWREVRLIDIVSVMLVISQTFSNKFL